MLCTYLHFVKVGIALQQEALRQKLPAKPCQAALLSEQPRLQHPQPALRWMREVSCYRARLIIHCLLFKESLSLMGIVFLAS